MNTDIRNLSKWLNEEQEAPIDRQALARVLAMAEQPAQQEPVIECDCETATSPDGSRLTKCGSDQMRRAVEEGHAFCKQPAPVQQEQSNKSLWMDCTALADAIHYPDCWDTGAYPELDDALHELAAWFKVSGCTTCAAQPAQQEPVAYAVYHRMGGGKSLHWPEQHSPNGDANEYQLVSLYTSPPAQRKPLPYNKEDMKGLDINQRLAFKLGWKSAEDAHNIKDQP